MAAKFDQQKYMKSKRGEGLKMEASGGGGIIVIGCALVVGAIGAAFVAHRARSRNKLGKQTKLDAVDKEEQRGLHSLLPSVGHNEDPRKEEFSVDSLVENISVKQEIIEGTVESKLEADTDDVVQEFSFDTILPMEENERPIIEIQAEEVREKEEEGSEESRDSSTESSAEAVWPVEIIDHEKEIPTIDLNVMKHQQDEGEGIQSISPRKEYIDDRSEEFAFGSSVEIQEKEINNSEMITEMTERQSSCENSTMVTETMENQLEDDTNNSNVTDSDFSFWSVKLNASQRQAEQYRGELNIAHVTKEGNLETREEKELFNVEEFEKREELEAIEASSKELSAYVTWAAKSIDQEESPSAETNEMKQQLEIFEKREDIFGSEAEDNMRTLQNLLPSTDSIEQQKGRTFVDTSEGTQGNSNGFKNSDVVLETRDYQSEANTNDDNGLVQEPDVTHVGQEDGSSIIKFQEEMELPIKDAGENGEEESEESRSSSVEFSDQAVWPADIIEQEKMDESMLITELKHQLEIPRKIEEMDGLAEDTTNYNNDIVQASLSDGVEFNMPNTDSGDNLKDSKIAHIEDEVVEEEEKQEEKRDDEQEGSSVKSLEEEIRSSDEEESEKEGSIGTRISVNEMLETTEKINQMVGVALAEEDENSTERIESFLPSSDKHNEISSDSSVSIQENVCMNLDVETEESQSTCKNSEMIMEIEERSSVGDIDHGDGAVKECLYGDVDFNFLKDQNKQDLEESGIAHVEEEVEDSTVASQEAGTESPIEEDGKKEKERSEKTRDSFMKISAETTSQTQFIEEEKGSALIENEMKLQFEVPQKTTDVVNIRQAEEDEEEHEQEVLKKGSETIVAEKEKRIDFILIGSSKVFLFLLALTLALGLLAFSHHEHLHNYKRRVPKIYRQLYQLFFPSYNEALGEL